MRKIGLVGGTGPESTLMYYKELNSRIDALTEREAMPDIAIESVDFRRAWRYVSEERYGLLADYLTEKLDNLIKGGAEVVSLSAVTMHVVFDEISSRISYPLISIPGAVRDHILENGIKRVGLLGTLYTMEMDYMSKPLQEAGIGVAIPSASERSMIGKRIFEELENGIVKESTLAEFRNIINRMKDEEGIEAVILGCTELPLLLNSSNCPVTCLDSVDIHIAKLIEEAMR